MKFQHIIISRFNLGLFGSHTKQDAENWMDYRLKIFDKYCYPSVASQTNQNFKWLILFDPDTPEKYKQIISKYEKVIPIYYKRTPCSLQILVMETIKQSINPDAEFIITTRIDVDDMISKDFVERTQIEMPMKHNTQLVFSLGYILRMHDNILMERKYVYNQFPSYIEKNTKDIKTVWFTSHGNIHKAEDTETKIITTGRMWCWFLHDKNMSKYSVPDNYTLHEVNIQDLQETFII